MLSVSTDEQAQVQPTLFSIEWNNSNTSLLIYQQYLTSEQISSQSGGSHFEEQMPVSAARRLRLP